MLFVFSFILLSILIFVFGNIWIYRYIVKKVLDLYLNFYFESKNLSIIRTKFVGLVNSGDFDTPFFVILPVSKGGKIFNNTYVDIYLEDSSGKEHRYTVRVKTFFLRIQKVTLKSKIENIEIDLPMQSSKNI
ncbi:MAG TPA: hypothetical protein PKX92_01400 [Edaphocola sp.]|nr:hypothetical protein [Edaphocola sp.]